jgi:hypothetical protein
LKEGELRLAVCLADLCAHHPDFSVQITTRELSQKTRLVPSSLNRAIKHLCDKRRGLVTLRAGSTTSASAYRCNFLATVRSASFGEALSKKAPPQTALSFEQQSASFGEAPPEVNRALTATEAALDKFRLQNPTLDRVLKSKVSDFDRPTVDYFRRALHGYMAKFGKDQTGRRYLDTGQVPHPPDNEIVARFLSVDQPHRLMPMIEALSWEAQKDDTLQPYSYGWFVAVALSRLAGIHFTETRKAEQQLRLHRRGQRAPAAPAEQTGLDFAAELVEAAAHGVKKIR